VVCGIAFVNFADVGCLLREDDRATTVSAVEMFGGR